MSGQSAKLEAQEMGASAADAARRAEQSMRQGTQDAKMAAQVSVLVIAACVCVDVWG